MGDGLFRRTHECRIVCYGVEAQQRVRNASSAVRESGQEFSQLARPHAKSRIRFNSPFEQMAPARQRPIENRALFRPAV
jgi:hypothetical protein